MFNKLKKAISSFINKAVKVLSSKKELEEAIEELKISLIENDVAYGVAEELAEKLMKYVEEGSIKTRNDLIEFLRETIVEFFKNAGELDIISEARKYKPYKIVFLGVNGVGKTTTIAKLALLYREKGFKPLMVAADTFRAGAQEQLKIHGDRLGIPVFMGKYGADPAAIVFDALQYAEKRGYDVVLIDTAGRMHTDIDLVEELRKIVRVAKPHRKILVVDALTGNDAIEQAKMFDEAVGVDGVIVTKVDAYEQGGVPLSIVYEIKKPVIFIGVGQGYKDIKPFNIREFVDKILPQ
ncbi:signal recognition particle-docking protein FtsY [Desulfurococcaceae archaeon MEX13E-LK6-19]|nr:signal recognition particle-docking protein FtsY [Desulfurococcaceae archaeon MEX13E-LK6-19]